MKLSSMILIILMIGFCFALVGSVVRDFETQYPEIDVNTSWEDEYNYAGSINESVMDIKDKFDIIGDDEVGWFAKLAAGIYAIPRAIILVPSVLFQTVSYGIIIVGDLGEEIGIPPFVASFAIVAIIIIIIFALVSFWHRAKA